MRTKIKLKIIKDILYAFLFNKRVPIIVGWNITYKCNLECVYCEKKNRQVPEMTTQEALNFVDQLSAAGTRAVAFSGGEPLLREDLGQIMQYCREKGLHVVLLSNATLISEKKDVVMLADSVKLSLDGLDDVTSASRGQGVFKSVTDAVRLLRSLKKQVSLSCVISKVNAGSMQDYLNWINENQIDVFFQPVGNFDTKNEGPQVDSVGLHGADTDDYKKAIDFLLQEKKNKNPYIKNSVIELEYMAEWPNSRNLDCVAHKVACIVEPDGSVFACDMFPDYTKYLVQGRHDFANAFKRSGLPDKCRGFCDGEMLGMNLFWELKWRAVVEVIKRLNQG